MRYITILFILLCACAPKAPQASHSDPQLIVLPPGLVLPDSGLRVSTGRIMPLPDLPAFGEYVPDIPALPGANWPELFNVRKIKNSPILLNLGDNNSITDAGKVKPVDKPQTISNDLDFLKKIGIWVGVAVVAGLLIYFLVRFFFKK